MNQVLVTGVSGFLGGHVALQLLKQGHSVIGTIQNSEKAAAIRKALGDAGAELGHLTLVELDLLRDEGWREAAAQSDCLIHVASPFVITMPNDPQELIKPAVEGTERALRAALLAGHSRIVVTSSLAAIDCGHSDYSKVFTEDDWTDLAGPDVTAYSASKTLAEQRAWELAEAAGATSRLAVINPSAILGPLIDDDPGTSALIVQRILKGEMPIVPNIILEYVDVRDVATAHVRALSDPVACGRRHILSDASLSLMEITMILRESFPEFHWKLPRREMPKWFAQLVSLFNKSLRDSRAYLGVRKRSDTSCGVSLLGHSLIPAAEAVRATARSMIERGLV